MLFYRSTKEMEKSPGLPYSMHLIISNAHLRAN
jgi:hypothetical protein